MEAQSRNENPVPIRTADERAEQLLAAAIQIVDNHHPHDDTSTAAIQDLFDKADYLRRTRALAASEAWAALAANPDESVLAEAQRLSEQAAKWANVSRSLHGLATFYAGGPGA